MATPGGDDKDAFLVAKDHFSMDTTIDQLGKNLMKSEKSIEEAMVALQKANNPDPANLAAMQFRINKWTLNFNMFSSMIKSVKDVASAIIQKI